MGHQRSDAVVLEPERAGGETICDVVDGSEGVAGSAVAMGGYFDGKGSPKTPG